MNRSRILIISSTAACVLVVVVIAMISHSIRKRPRLQPAVSQTRSASESPSVAQSAVVGAPSNPPATVSSNPLAGRAFYIDGSRSIAKLRAQLLVKNDLGNADLAGRIADQPGTTWLIGPSSNDPLGSHDIAEVTRTSTEAAAQGTVPIYELYAIPRRDACANYSKGGFKNQQEYLNWLESVIGALKTDAVFSVEADAVAQNVRGDCLTASDKELRYAVLTSALARLQRSPRVLASYLDAGHSEWFSDPSVLVEPLGHAGIVYARGIAVNVSNFVATTETVTWSQNLLGLLGGNKGAIIDTSRNGNGIPPKSVTGDARWCNPTGRAIGPPPTTTAGQTGIDAFFWGKVIGESDGSCFGNPEAGVFVPSLALDLARNER
jgi:endoglucanase